MSQTFVIPSNQTIFHGKRNTTLKIEKRCSNLCKRKVNVEHLSIVIEPGS